MEKHAKARVSKESQVNTYAEMWQASWVLFQKTKEDPEGSYYLIMASLIFAAFTLESYLNHVGEKIFKCWKDLESLSPQGKLSLICEQLGIPKDDSKRPFQTIANLLKFRNYLAHGKTVYLKSNDQIKVVDENFDNFLREPLKTRWQMFCKPNHAECVREDIKKIIGEIQDKSGVTDSLFDLGTWGYTSTVHSGSL